jgi:hypothetical protein
MQKFQGHSPISGLDQNVHDLFRRQGQQVSLFFHEKPSFLVFNSILSGFKFNFDWTKRKHAL